MFENPCWPLIVLAKERDKEIMRGEKSDSVPLNYSNLKLGSGVAPISSYLNEGIRVVAATDGAAKQ